MAGIEFSQAATEYLAGVLRGIGRMSEGERVEIEGCPWMDRAVVVRLHGGGDRTLATAMIESRDVIEDCRADLGFAHGEGLRQRFDAFVAEGRT